LVKFSLQKSFSFVSTSVLVVPLVGDRRAVLILMLVLVFVLLQVPNAYSSESTAEDKLSEFLSSVVGLDLTKYALVPPSLPPGVEYPSNLSETLPPLNFTLDDQFGGLVEEEVLSYDLEYNESRIHIMGIFYNGHMAFLAVSPQGDYVYSESPPTDVLNQAKGIIQRYQTFVSQNYAKDASYLVPMLNVLSSVGDLPPTEISDGNITFQVSKDGDRTRIQWIYTESGVLMNYKRVGIEFRNSTFESFRDTWSLYSVSGLSVISSEEAVQIALEAAQNCDLHIFNQDKNETQNIKPPDLSDAPYDVSLTMVPYRYLDYHIPSKMPRDPLTLYPFWQVHFYFEENIAGNVGMQVGVWGDTREIVYCSGFGYLGASGTPTEQDITELPPDDQPLEEQKQLNPFNPSTLAVAVSLAVVLIVSISVIALRRKNRHK
jgi:hypothetical protein